MYFADIHNHMLFGVDDGASTAIEMYQIMDASFADGVRHLCFTPHFHPGYFGEHQQQIDEAFTLAKSYAASKYPDLRLYLGNELRYERSCMEWLEQGRCRTLNGTSYLLVDFLYSESIDHILNAMLRILNAGYTPILAHVERYEKFHRDLREVEQLKSWGVILQVDAQSLLGGLGHGSKVRSRRILDAYLADLVASDAHDLTDRPPQLASCFNYVSKRYDREYAEKLFLYHPLCFLNGKDL